jgi:hypothetical protein
MPGELRTLFDRALAIFLEKEHANIARDASERNLCQRLSIALERLKNEFGCESAPNREPADVNAFRNLRCRSPFGPHAE